MIKTQIVTLDIKSNNQLYTVYIDALKKKKQQIDCRYKGWKKIGHANSKHKRVAVNMLTSK